MKKILLTGIVILIAVFFVTCEEFFPAEKEVEYTDVEYSLDGSSVTVYLDGVGVPKTGAQRAMTTDLAKLAYDYFEVIFITSTTNARASWELGQSAGISGVYRTTAGVDYKWDNTPSATVGRALMFVGRKDSKLLLGIGQIGLVDADPPGTGTLPGIIDALIKSDSQKVVFFIEPIKTGLTATGDTGTPVVDSFDFVTGSTDVASWTRADHSQYISLGTSPAVQYPLYTLPQKKDSTGGAIAEPEQHATYTFGGGASTFKNIIMLNGAIKIERRLPRYLDGGRYYAPKGANFDTKSLVSYRGTAPSAGSALNNVIPLVFTTKGNGMFSFYIEVPVYMVNKNTATNSGPAAEIWKIRTGFGSELVSLDDGKDGIGGCVLMGVGNTGTDWLEIEWEWLK